MIKKKLDTESKKVWECKFGCKLTKTGCKHLQAILDKNKKLKPTLVSERTIQYLQEMGWSNTYQDDVTSEYHEKWDVLFTKLVQLGASPRDVEIYLQLVVDKIPQRRMYEEFHIPYVKMYEIRDRLTALVKSNIEVFNNDDEE